MSGISREDFFASAPAPAVEEVKLPGGRGPVYVRQITAGERDRFEADAQGKGLADLRARVVVAMAVDSEGRPLFGYQDVPRLTALPAFYLEPIVEAATRLNAISDRDVEALAGNSGATP